MLNVYSVTQPLPELRWIATLVAPIFSMSPVARTEKKMLRPPLLAFESVTVVREIRSLARVSAAWTGTLHSITIHNNTGKT